MQRVLTMAKISATEWNLPGLKVAVTADSISFSKDTTGENLDIAYVGITGTRWDITPAE